MKLSKMVRKLREAREVVKGARDLGTLVADEAERTTEDLRALGEEAQGIVQDARALTRPVAEAFTRLLRRPDEKPPAQRVDVQQGTPRQRS